MNLDTVIDCQLIFDKKRFLTRPDFQAIFNVVTVNREDGWIIRESNSTEGLYAALEEHFHVLSDEGYCNLMHLLDLDVYNNLTVYWAKNEKGISLPLENIEKIKQDFKPQDLHELNRFLVKIFQHPLQKDY